MTFIDLSNGAALQQGDVAGNITATGTYPGTSGIAYPGPYYHLVIDGTWGGTSVELQEKAVGHSTWMAIGTYTSDTNVLCRFSSQSNFRIVLTGGAGMTLKATLNEFKGQRHV